MAEFPSTSLAHTPAPWSLNKDEVYGNDGATFVAEVFHENESWKANARLIATAPQMLQRLQTLLEELEGMKTMMLSSTENDSWMVTEDGWRAIIDATQAVIAEAHGKTPTLNTFHCNNCGEIIQYQEDLRTPEQTSDVLCPNCDDPPQHRILITVSGGVAECAADDDVEVCLIDFDNEPNKKIPADFADLKPELCTVSASL